MVKEKFDNEYKLNKLKLEIKDAYEKYFDENVLKDVSIKNLLKYFNISIDESRVEDYSIVIPDKDKLFIQVFDEKTGIGYTSEYTNKAELFNRIDSDTKYICVKSFTSTYNTEKLYLIGDNSATKERIVFGADEHVLIFERDWSNDSQEPAWEWECSFELMDSERAKVQELWHNMFVTRKPLLTKSYKIHDTMYENRALEVELSNIGGVHVQPQMRYSYLIDKKVVYGVFDVRSHSNDFTYTISGVCFENTEIENLFDLLPLSISDKYIDCLEDGCNDSVMVFYGIVNGVGYKAEIYKNIFDRNMSNIHIRYTVNNCKTGAKNELEQTIPTNTGYITSEEVRLIIETLRSNYSDDFIPLLTNELERFAEKIDIRDEKIEETDLTNPVLFTSMPLDEIVSTIGPNIDAYKNEMLKQYNDIIAYSQEYGKGYQKK